MIYVGEGFGRRFLTPGPPGESLWGLLGLSHMLPASGG